VSHTATFVSLNLRLKDLLGLLTGVKKSIPLRGGTRACPTPLASSALVLVRAPSVGSAALVYLLMPCKLLPDDESVSHPTCRADGVGLLLLLLHSRYRS